MKKSRVLLILLALVLLLSGCSNSGNTGKKITLADLQKVLESYDVKLDTVDGGKGLSQFTVTASKVNTDKLMDRGYVREAYKLTMTNPGKSTYGHFQVMKAFGPVMAVMGMLDTTPSGSFDTDAFVDEVLDAICGGKVHSEAGWTISVKVDKQNSTLTITGTRQ